MGKLARKERLMGFGHRVYKAGDVRAGILKPYTQRVASAAGFGEYEKIADIVEEVMARKEDVSERRLAGGPALSCDGT